MSLLLFTWDENVELASKTVLTHLAVHENLRGHPANREPAWGVIQLFNRGVQRVREPKVRDFCNGALLSKQDVPVGGWVEIWIFLPIWWLGYYLAARSPCTILCCSRNSIPRLTFNSKIFTETGRKKSFLPGSYISQGVCCSTVQTQIWSEIVLKLSQALEILTLRCFVSGGKKSSLFFCSSFSRFPCTVFSWLSGSWIRVGSVMNISSI